MSSPFQSGWSLYVPGKVEAIVRNEAGEVIMKDCRTAGKAAGVRLLKEEHAIAVDGVFDLYYLRNRR